MRRIVGIDLGTTQCSVAAVLSGRPVIIPNTHGNPATPSVVAFCTDGRILVGEDALSQAVLNVKNTFFNTKRGIGTSQTYDASGQSVRPQQILTLLLLEMKRIAETYLDEIVDHAVVSVPGYFNDAQRWSIYEAAREAGLDVMRIMSESTAAALYYGYSLPGGPHNEVRRKNMKLAIYDLGGGTFDVSVLETGEGVFEVLAVNGDTCLGGIDFDKRIADRLVDGFMRDSGVDLRLDPTALERLMEAAEAAKIELSSTNQANIHVPYIATSKQCMLDLRAKLTRRELEEMTSDLIRKTNDKCKQALKDACLSRKGIDEVVLVGRQTRMPAVRRSVAQFFGMNPSTNVDPSNAVALGSAVLAAVLAGDVKDVLLLDVTPHSLGVQDSDGMMVTIIERNSTIPTKKSRYFTTAVDNQVGLTLDVLQGESAVAEENYYIGKLEFMGIPPSRREVPQIEVSFELEADGILYVQARESATGIATKVRIQGRGHLIQPTPGSVCPYGRWPGEHLGGRGRAKETRLVSQKSAASLVRDEAAKLAYEEAVKLMGKNEWAAAAEKLTEVIESRLELPGVHGMLSEAYSRMADESGISFHRRRRFKRLARQHLNKAKRER